MHEAWRSQRRCNRRAPAHEEAILLRAAESSRWRLPAGTLYSTQHPIYTRDNSRPPQFPNVLITVQSHSVGKTSIK